MCPSVIVTVVVRGPIYTILDLATMFQWRGPPTVLGFCRVCTCRWVQVPTWGIIFFDCFFFVLRGFSTT
jgi:hypothetical protein